MNAKKILKSKFIPLFVFCIFVFLIKTGALKPQAVYAGLPCYCPGGCCPHEIKPNGLWPNPCSEDEIDCNDPMNDGIDCYFPWVSPITGEPYEQCPWRQEGEFDCNPYQWAPNATPPYQAYVDEPNPSSECEDPLVRHPEDESCFYQVPAQNFFAIGHEECNNPGFRDLCNRSSGMMSPGVVCEKASYVAYIRKMNQCCDPVANFIDASNPTKETKVCSAEGSPEGRCSMCNTWEGTMCVDGVTDVCRKAILVQTYEKRTRSANPPADAMCAACIERQVEGEEIYCDEPYCLAGSGDCPSGRDAFSSSHPDCSGCPNSCCGNDNAGYSCARHDCDGNGENDCCAACKSSTECYDIQCDPDGSSGEDYPFYGDNVTCSGSDQDAECAGQSEPCLDATSCCRIQNKQGDNVCTWAPGDCVDADGNAYCPPNKCLKGFNTDDPENPIPICEDAVETPCGLCCGEEYCGEDNNHDAFPPEVDHCTLYEYTIRENMYKVIYYSNAISTNFKLENLSSQHVQDVRAILELPDFLDYGGASGNPDIYCEGQKVSGLGEYRSNECHGGILVWNIRNVVKDPIENPKGLDLFGKNTSITINLTLVPSDVDSNGKSYYSDHCIDLSQVNHYTENLYSDDRLANMEMKVYWPAADLQIGTGSQGKVEAQYTSRVIEPMSFWIGKGVVSDAEPVCSGDECFTDPDARPFGWPVYGQILEDWGGVMNASSFSGVDWTNPLAADTAYDAGHKEPRVTLTYGQSGEYIKGCGDSDRRGGWRHTGVSIVPSEGQASPPYVYSTHAGYVTHVGYGREDAEDEDATTTPSASNHPGRGFYVEIGSTTDDDCQYNFLTRYGNLDPTTVRVEKGDYVPRHKILGVMGNTGDTGALLSLTGQTGITKTLYQIRYGRPDWEYPDYADNNLPYGDLTRDGYSIDPVSIRDPDYIMYPQEGDEVTAFGSIELDNCVDNPYICEDPEHPGYFSYAYGPCDQNGSVSYFFCTNRRRPETVNRCFYSNP